MGGGASVLSSEDFVTMSQNLKEEYELLISAGHTDDEIRSKLMEKYNELFTSDAAAAEEGADADAVGDAAIPEGGVDAAPVEIALGVSESTVSLSGVTVSSPVPETTVGLTEKAKKARKRRGTFENDKVVTASKQPPLPANGAIVEITLEE